LFRNDRVLPAPVKDVEVLLVATRRRIHTRSPRSTIASSSQSGTSVIWSIKVRRTSAASALSSSARDFRRAPSRARDRSCSCWGAEAEGVPRRWRSGLRAFLRTSIACISPFMTG